MSSRFQKGIVPWNKGKKIIKTCTFCGTRFSGRGVKYCSLQCAGKARLGMVFSENLGRKKGCVPYNKGKKSPETSGENNGKWIKDRTLLKDDDKERGGQLHREWSKNVKKRDKWVCRIADNNCDGRLEAHHILGWTKYPELKYDLNNGITLCHFHHPRVREEEKRLIPTFKELVSVSNILI